MKNKLSSQLSKSISLVIRYDDGSTLLTPCKVYSKEICLIVYIKYFVNILIKYI